MLAVCAKLHNFCLNSNIPLFQHRYYQDCRERDELEVILNDGDDDHEAGPIPGYHANRRTNFTRELELKGIRRPAFAAMNFRA